MTAVTVPLDTPRQAGRLRSHALLADAIVWAGILAVLDDTGFLISGTDSAGSRFAGVVTADADNTDGDDGDISVDVEAEGVFLFTLQGGTAETDVGREVYVKDNATVAKIADVTNRVRVGTIVEVHDSTRVWVRLEVLTGARDGVYSVQKVGSNNAALDLSSLAAQYGGTDFLVRRVIHAESYLTADGTLVDGLLASTTDYTLADGVLTCVGDQTARTWKITFEGTLI